MPGTSESSELTDQLRRALASAPSTISWTRPASPADAFAALADAARDLGVDAFDQYGEGGAVAMLEEEVAQVLGTPGAAYFPSGVMAQQIALRIWADRSGSRRVAMPDLSHLLVHEEDGPRILQDLRIEHLTTGPVTPTAAHVDALPGRLAAVLVELPLRDAGCAVPSFEDLAAISAACRERGIRLHLDGARLWEAQPALGRPLAEIVALADTVYVSLYKGLGGQAGSVLVGPADVLAEARVWRRRAGGTIFRQTAEAVSGLVGLRERLPLMPDVVAWAGRLAAALPAGITVQPEVPRTNTFLLHAAGDAEDANRRSLALATGRGIALTSPWRAGTEPGRTTAEVVVGDGALGLDPEEAAALVAQVAGV
ncbi:threonine aldolase [Paraoerskovia sediminicola]|uniref:Threonine aldolase n=1 Tax=Paraoerskovia sediminicola TaxID=1138587 RepID=A0ABM8G5X9_9CELL|nr:beta-eliminating lyase-related protein [Paraoerskovia sediminicola]BDZ43457.1 threonine aldolase [Paraoerskovia sediminicola]